MKGVNNVADCTDNNLLLGYSDDIVVVKQEGFGKSTNIISDKLETSNRGQKSHEPKFTLVISETQKKKMKKQNRMKINDEAVNENNEKFSFPTSSKIVIQEVLGFNSSSDNI